MYSFDQIKSTGDAPKLASKYEAVILIDDRRTDNFIAKSVVKNCNFAKYTEVYDNAENALEYLKTMYSADILIDMHYPEYIFLDINMPHMNGFQFLEAFEKIDFRQNKIPRIIMLTSSISPGDEKMAYSFKSVHKFFRKPLSAQALEAL